MDRHLHRPRYPNLAIREVGDVNMSNQQLIVLCAVICLVGFRQVVFALGIMLTPFALVVGFMFEAMIWVKNLIIAIWRG